MLRIKQTHGANPASYHYWGGEWEISETYTGFGDDLGSVIPIVTLDEAEFNAFKSWVDNRLTARYADFPT
jgi:hypothetical protein